MLQTILARLYPIFWIWIHLSVLFSEEISGPCQKYTRGCSFKTQFWLNLDCNVLDAWNMVLLFTVVLFYFHESKQTLILFPHPASAQTTSGTFQSSSIAHHIRLGTMQLSKISKEIRLKSEWNDINIHNLFFQWLPSSVRLPSGGSDLGLCEGQSCHVQHLHQGGQDGVDW